MGKQKKSAANDFKPQNEPCPHTHIRRVFAKNMCVSCYYQREGKKNAWACEHKKKKHYSKGLCQNCYLTNYYRMRRAKA